jgi:8-oxo-dGTP pyrophosphatase MutT (NUDIX family)
MKSKDLEFGKQLAGVKYRDRPAAYAVITNGGGKVAAVRGKRGNYFLPGGGSLPGEKSEVTIEREVREELARNVRLILKIGEAIQYFSVGESNYRMTAVFYKAEFVGEREGKAEHELEWLDREAMEAKFFHECHKWAVRESGL